MCAAKMVMQSWAREYMQILTKAGLKIPLMKGDVDDGRQGSKVLRKGMMFDVNLGEFRMDNNQYVRDVEENLPDNVKMARACLPAMDSINTDLRFTTEAPEEFEKNRLPTLDFMIWLKKYLLRKINEISIYNNAKVCNVRAPEDVHPK